MNAMLNSTFQTDGTDPAMDQRIRTIFEYFCSLYGQRNGWLVNLQNGVLSIQAPDGVILADINPADFTQSLLEGEYRKFGNRCNPEI